MINESISTAAGAGHGQLLKPKDIRHLIRQAGRIPAQRATSYRIIKTFVSDESTDLLDEVQNTSQFGSYHELIKLATSYRIIKTFASDEGTDLLDKVQNTSQFGSYHELIKLDGYRYKNNRRR
ncbi:7,8-didemethyl-8-hydroxy-5-deazariboflavin synthase subunit 2 [Candidatus Nitrosotalea sp. FS]|nr:7,8-didemethyl-8-hydroxy-5-deazariboflavin synthase subunit 2 [Candidatus Nitrosotalea sp. FS]